MILPPAQQASFLAVTTLVQSVVDDIENRRREEEEKLRRASRQDKMMTAWVQANTVEQSANTKINEHFFGALKRDENPMAVLIARFMDALGVAQEPGETATDLATRLSDNLTLVDTISFSDSTDPLMKVTPARFKVTGDEISAVQDGSAEKPSAMAELFGRFATRNGIARDDGESSQAYNDRIGDTLKTFRKSLPVSVSALETSSGLSDLGLSAKDMIRAIANPGGPDAQMIQDRLDAKAAEDGLASDDMTKVIQRLEQVADPKTVEELKVERAEGDGDPTRVEDAETRQEREGDIQTLEAAEKLEDVQKVQDAVKAGNDAAVEAGDTDDDAGAADPLATAMETIQILAAGAEAIKATDAAALPEDPAAGSDAAGAPEIENGRMTDEDQAVLLAEAGSPDDATDGAAARNDILAIHVDENGLYDYLRRKQEADLAA